MDPSQLSKTFSLVAVSFLLLPLSISILVFSYVRQIPARFSTSRASLRRHPAFRPRTIVVTGAGTASGLRISRALYEAGHNVVGADFEPDHIPTYARFSKAFEKFYPLRLPNESYDAWLYIQDLVRIVQTEKASLWLNCSNRISPQADAQARQVLQEKTACTTFALDTTTVSHFSDKAHFLEFTKTLGLPSPEIHPVNSRAQIHDVLNSSHHRKKYILNTHDRTIRSNSSAVMLPRRTLSQTYAQVSKIQVTKEAPLVLEQHLENTHRYATFAVIVGGDLLAFAASALKDSNSCQEAIPTSSGVGRAMQQYTQTFAQRAGPTFTAHLSMEFRIAEKDTEWGFDSTVMAVSCHPQPSLAALLFSDLHGSLDLARAYLSALDAPATPNGHNNADEELATSTPNPASPGVYFIGPDILTLLLQPLFSLVKFQTTVSTVLHSLSIFATHLLFWREGTFEAWDPLPLFALYHLFLPVHLMLAVLGGGSAGMPVQ